MKLKTLREIKIDELLVKRDNLSETLKFRRNEIKGLREGFEFSLKDRVEHINSLEGKIELIRSDLYEMGVNVEDC